jgi:hypothetical protein
VPRNNLVGFLNLIKDFRLSRSLIQKSQKLRFPVQLIKTVKELGSVLEQRERGDWLMAFDVPSGGQSFDGLVMDAGIEEVMPRDFSSDLPELLCARHAGRPGS